MCVFCFVFCFFCFYISRKKLLNFLSTVWATKSQVYIYQLTTKIAEAPFCNNPNTVFLFSYLDWSYNSFSFLFFFFAYARILHFILQSKTGNSKYLKIPYLIYFPIFLFSLSIFFLRGQYWFFSPDFFYFNLIFYSRNPHN